MSPVIHNLAYASPRGDARRQPHVAFPRDPEASSALAYALHEQRGAGFGRTVLNYPGRWRSYDLLPDDRLRQVWLPFLRPEDILICATRPPLSDGDHGDNKKLEPSNTVLERIVFRHYWRYLEIVARSHIALARETAKLLPQGKRNRADVTFYQEKGCRIQHLRAWNSETRSRKSPLGNVTLGFLLSVESLWRGGPSFVGAWSMDALATYGWCAHLRHRRPDLLARPGLTVVELDMSKGPQPSQPDTLDWVLDWGVDELLWTAGERPPRAHELASPLAIAS